MPAWMARMGSRTIGVYGGSFNPPHVGHALVVGWLQWTDRVDEVWLVPSYRHPFDKPLAPFEERVAWCRAMAADVGGSVRVSTVERRLPTPSYTIDVLRALARESPALRLRLVVGADTLRQVHLWKDWAAIEREFAPLVVGRAGFPPRPDAPTFPDVSSTEVRRRLAAGEPVDHLLTRSVLGPVLAHRWS